METATKTRQRILEAADRVMRTKGVARATTKEIARAAEVSEGTLYNHFKNKPELFLCVLRELPSHFMQQVMHLRQQVGQGSVRDNLSQLAVSALTFYQTSIPMGASFFSDPELLTLHREELKSRGAGPHRANEALAAYLRAEQQLGRLSAHTDPDAAAYLLLGACFQKAYWTQFWGEQDAPEDDTSFIQGLLNMLLPASH